MAATTLAPNPTATFEPSSMPLHVIEDELCRRAANLTAAEAQWLALIAEFDRRRGWEVWGCVSCAAWLSWQVGLDIRAAREKVRVANALVHLPLLAAAMARGQLSYTKVRALTRIAHERNEEGLVLLGLSNTANHVERIVTAYLRCEPAAEDADARAHRDRGMWVRGADAECELTVRLPAEAAKAVLAAIDAFVGESAGGDSHAQRRVDALVTLAEHAVATRGGSHRHDPRYLATVVLTPEAVAVDREDGGGCCTVAAADGTRGDAEIGIPSTTASRMLCDAVVEGLLVDDRGDPLRLGRRRRIVSARLKRALWLRDRGCRFPGCTNRGWLDAHHIVHWLDLGHTEKENLVLVCRAHHRFLHEHHWKIVGDPGGEIYFCPPSGEALASSPPAPIGDPCAVERHRCAADDARPGWLANLLDVHTWVGELIHDDLIRESG